MTIDDAISHAEEVANASDTPCARQHRQLADWLRELKRLRKSNDKRCNAAAMREALLRCEAISCLPEIREQQSVRDMRNIIAAALSAPARNCDIYPKRDDAGEAWNKTLDERTRDMVQRYPLTAMDMFIDWLLDTATENGGAK